MESKQSNSESKLHDIQVQMEYYLSDENLKKDGFFHEKISTDPNGYVDLSFFLKCNKIINAGWSKADLIEGIKQSSAIELDSTSERVRRKDNKPLPELTLLSKKRKKEDEEEKEEEEKQTVDPVILEVSTESECNSKWKNILQEFKDQNPTLDVTYGRFKGKEGHFAVLVKPGDELQFKDSFELDGFTFKVAKCQGDKLIDFWKDHGSHYEMCTKKSKETKNGKGKKKKKSTFLETPVVLGGDRYTDITLVRAQARKIMTNTADDTKLEGKDKDFILDCLKFHHNYDEKIKDMDYITTGKPDKFSFSRCFFIVKKGGEKVDFSIQKCVDAIEHKQNEK